jgi:hypothetical protein
LIIAAMDGVRRAAPTRVPCIRSSGAAARVARSRGRGRAYTVRTLKPLPVTSLATSTTDRDTVASTVHKKSRFRVTPRSPRPVYLGLTWAGSIPGLNLGWLLSAPLRSSGCVQPPGRRGYCYCGYGVCKYLRPAATSIGFQAAISSSSGPCLLLQSSSHH